MQILYSSTGKAMYDCSHARSDHTNTPGCRSIIAAIVDAAVAQRMLAVVTPTEIAVALAAADEVVDRRARSTRALELRLERARYDAARAERAFHRCEPENRLVARSLEHRWEDMLEGIDRRRGRVGGGAGGRDAAPAARGPRSVGRGSATLVACVDHLSKDRKRLLRTVVADVTLISAPSRDAGACRHPLALGCDGRSGRRPPGPGQHHAPNPDGRDRVRDTASRHARRGTGGRAQRRGFQDRDRSILRCGRRTLASFCVPDGVAFAPRRSLLGNSRSRTSRRDSGSRRVPCIIGSLKASSRRGAIIAAAGACPSPPSVEEACRQRVLTSAHIKRRTQTCTVGGAV